MCLGMNPDQLSPGAMRFDVQPQFRRPAGQRRPHPPGVTAVAAATAVRGTLSSPVDLEN